MTIVGTTKERVDFAKIAESRDSQAADISGFHIVLASSSPRRADIMKRHGVNPVIMPADTEETIPSGLDVRQAVMYLALEKALWVEGSIQAAAPLAKAVGAAAEPAAAAYIVAADTVVYKNTIIGKPADANEAWAFLEKLRGVSHNVYTGVAILELGSKKRKVFYEKTKVFFKDYSEKDLRGYIQSGEPLDKAGAYAIQGGFAPFINRIEGDLNNVIGFPWRRFSYEILELSSSSKF